MTPGSVSRADRAWWMLARRGRTIPSSLSTRLDHTMLWDVHPVVRRPGMVGWQTRKRAEEGIVDGGGAAVGIRHKTELYASSSLR
jgi:hypothetical protein